MNLEDVRTALDGSMDVRQQQVEDAAKIIDNNESVVLQRPVGTGKTETTIQAMLGDALSSEDDYQALILGPSNSVVNQWSDRLTEYNLDEVFDIKVNKKKSEFSQHQNIMAANTASRGRTKRRSMQAVEDQELKKHKEKVFGAENVPFSDSDKIWGQHNVDTTGADIVLSTYHLLDSDIDNNRVDLGGINFDDVVIDEATAVVARDEFQNKDSGENFFGGYKVSKPFEDIVNQTAGTSRYIALTALPGRKLDAIQDYLGAALIRPEESDLQESMANVTERMHSFGESASEEDVFGKERGVVQNRLNSVEDTLGNFRNELKGKVRDAGGKADMKTSAYAYANSNDEAIRNAAVKALSYEHKAQMLHEGGVEILEGDFDEDLPEDYTDPKIDGLQTLTSHWDQEGENYVVFTSHKETAEYLNQIAEGSTAVVDGDKSESQNEETLEQFGEEFNGIFMTYGYGGEGIDLPEGDRIVHMTDHIDPELKQSATGRAKRGKDITEHTLLYDFEEATQYDSSEFVEDDNLSSHPVTRAQLRHLLGENSAWEQIITEEQYRENSREYDHILNTEPKGRS